MANTTPLYDNEEDYIDMELTSSTKSSPQNKEFEFQMALTTNDKNTTTSPADELFYKGKLLPLHLPPRRQMVENLLLHHPSSTSSIFNIDQEHYHTAPCTHTTNTPLDSCNISPSESCRVSCELNPDDYFYEWSTELSSFINHQYNPTKKSWSKKLKLIKHSVLSQKLKASRAYLKSFFTKPACSDDQKQNPSLLKTAEEAEKKYLLKINAKKKPFGQIGKAAYPTIATIIKNIDKEVMNEDSGASVHRKSFSGAIKRHSPVKCLSSSSSSNSSSTASSNSSSFSMNSNGGHHEMQFLRRSSSATEIEGSIEAAIAHCKKSQQLFDERSTCNNQVGQHCSLSVSRIGDGDDQKRPGLCTI